MALEAFKSQPGIDIGSGVPLIARGKKCRKGKENDRGEDLHVRWFPSVLAEAKCTG